MNSSNTSPSLVEDMREVDIYALGLHAPLRIGRTRARRLRRSGNRQVTTPDREIGF